MPQDWRGTAPYAEPLELPKTFASYASDGRIINGPLEHPRIVDYFAFYVRNLLDYLFDPHKVRTAIAQEHGHEDVQAGLSGQRSFVQMVHHAKRAGEHGLHTLRPRRIPTLQTGAVFHGSGWRISCEQCTELRTKAASTTCILSTASMRCRKFRGVSLPIGFQRTRPGLHNLPCNTGAQNTSRRLAFPERTGGGLKTWAPQLAEFELRGQGGRLRDSSTCPFNYQPFNYLFVWGFYRLMIELHFLFARETFGSGA